MSCDQVAIASLELYVMGVLDVVHAAQVERHVSECPSCAERLAREARLEMAFEQIGRRLRQPAVAPAKMAPENLRRGLGVAAGSALVGALALAAAVLVWVGRGTSVDVRPGGGSALGVPAREMEGMSHARRIEDASESTASLDAMRLLDALDGG